MRFIEMDISDIPIPLQLQLVPEASRAELEDDIEEYLEEYVAFVNQTHLPGEVPITLEMLKHRINNPTLN